MILYFDNYITNQPFHKGSHETLGEVRNSGSKIYKTPSKLDITIYTLTSYAEIKWSNVIIKYELEDISKKKYFEKEVKKLFPKAILIYGRSDSQKKFQESIKLIDTLKDDWIFYAGNNDHPFISPNLKTLEECLKKAKKIKKKEKWVSIILSHFPEFYNKTIKGTPYHELNAKNVKKIQENQYCIVSLYPKGLMHSMQIVHKNLFKHWFFSGDSKGANIRRSECIERFVKIKNQFVIVPKEELCIHFDGEIVQKYAATNISYDISPPLFIPPGFFNKMIRIRFGYKDYKEEFVNVNPLKEKYSFRDLKNGTDLKIGLENIPLFWKRRISKIDINPKANMQKINEAVKKRYEKLRNPHTPKSKIFYWFYRNKSEFERFLFSIGIIRKPVKYLMKKFPKVKEIYRRTRNIKHR